MRFPIGGGEREEMALIADACFMAGFAEQASDFILSGKTFDEVLGELEAMPGSRIAPGGSRRLVGGSPRFVAQHRGNRRSGGSWERVINRINSRLR